MSTVHQRHIVRSKGIPVEPTASSSSPESFSHVPEEKSSLLSLLLYILQIAYTVFLLLTHIWSITKQLYCAPVSTVRLGWYWIRRYARGWIGENRLTHFSHSTTTSLPAIKRIPQALAFAFGSGLFEWDQLSIRYDDNSETKDGNEADPSHQPDITRCTDLIQTCCKMEIPELLMFDREGLFSHQWPSLASALAPTTTGSNTRIFVLQGSPTLDSQSAPGKSVGDDTKEQVESHTTQLPRRSIQPGQVILVFDGVVEVVDALTLLGAAGESDNSGGSAASVASTGSSTHSPSPSLDWRSSMRSHVAQRNSLAASSITPSSPRSVHLLSFLGPEHGEDALVRASMDLSRRKLKGESNDAPAPGSKRTSHELRLQLQRSILPLPINEPDMLVVVRRASRFHRSLRSFPPWLLRIAEIFHSFDLHSLVEGGELYDRLTQFGRTVQRGGT